ncbi:Alpha/Beta hydrolase protein [Thamnocephalis sphaerospora]|uniref:Alpha/Beta hydrolase protein n=1 Tax=Thamnocephalis sphaerospora TaxID=78915 RepID=A0A4P9XMF3_9FUNG|nr:Alpha/Beta hydrolase protein [Thamnocephalis sphaerospora]|eukprot:RKP07036.1 Alpha/Beta hydrolase protein [Thamnocephalis sphaerospora]
MLVDDARVTAWNYDDKQAHYVAVSDHARAVVLAFRGTVTIKEIVSNFDRRPVVPPANVFPGMPINSKMPCGMQLGFLDQLNVARDAVSAALQQNPGYQLIVTGHSLGSVYAHLFALHIRLTLPSWPQPFVYAYSEPLSASTDFADWALDVIHVSRYSFVTSSNDVVPNMFGADDRYSHARFAVEVYFPDPTQPIVRQCNRSNDENCLIGVSCDKLSWSNHGIFGGLRMSELLQLADITPA